MITFNNLRLLSESIRQGLPSIENMKHEDFHNLISGGKVPIHSVTEKTDGSTFKFGHDEHGFYSQSSGSGSERMRTPEDYRARVDKRSKETGQPADYTGADAFAKAHAAMQKNPKLLGHLRSHYERHGAAEVRGELFSHHLSRPSDTKKGEVKLVGTSYDPKRWGKIGQVVLHTKLTENEKHDPNHFKHNLSDENINFEDDKVEHKPAHVDVSDEHGEYQKLNHDLLRSRTTRTNKEAKEAELAKLKAIQKRVSDKVDAHVRKLGIRPKFGSGTEGLVVHPKPGTKAPRYKVTSAAFRQHKATTSREDFKKRLQKENFISFADYALLTEGGNIKVKTEKGEVSAAPFKVRDRAEQVRHVRQALSDIHDAFRKAHKQHLFGKNASALNKGAIYGGSTKDFMNRVNVPDEEFVKHKPAVGDIDAQVSHEHKNKLASVLTPGTRFGPYTTVGTKKHGNEISAVMRHDNGEHHQFDFEGVETDENGPTRASQFLHSSNWEDTKKGIKGMHHKVLLNAAGGGTHKFSITHGLRSREDESDPGVKNPDEVSARLFGDSADHSNIHSFGGVAELVKKHIPKERHQEIYDKFVSSVSTKKDTDHGPAIAHLRRVLGTKDVMKEEADGEHHVHVSFLGASPFPHEGHHKDIVGSMSNAPSGRKFVGLSGKSEAFSDEEREGIANKQSGGKAEFRIEKTAGQTVGRAHDSVAGKSGRKVLHLHFGHDRKKMAEGLKKSVEAGKIPEMGGGKFDEVRIHYPEGDREHGMSGTKMRKAAHEGNLDEFHRHIGPNFSRSEARTLMSRVKKGIKAGTIPLLREEMTRKDFGPMLSSFVKFASDKLGIESMPKIRYKTEDDDYNSFAAYNPSKNELSIQTMNRHPMDVCRSIAHELVHHRQNETGKIGKDIEKEGSTGSPQENEANAVAGKIMRWFAKANPDAFSLSHIVEEKQAIFVVGGPCSGKDAIVRQLKESSDDFREIDINQLTFNLNNLQDQIVINAPANDFDSISAANEMLRDLNYQTSMIFVDVENNISKLRNEQRAARGQRVIAESVRFAKYSASKENMDKFIEMFGDMFVVDNTETVTEGRCWKGYRAVKSKTPYTKGSCEKIRESLHDWFKSKSPKTGARGWVQVGGKYDGYPCARQPGQTSTPKCRSSGERSRMSKKQKEYAFRKKNREDANQPEKSGGAKPTMVKTYKEEKDACYNKVKSRYDVFPSAYASGALVKCRKVGAANWGNKSKKGMDEDFEKYMKDSGNRLEGTKSLVKIYKKSTPNEMAKDNGFERTTSTHPLVPEEKKKKVMKRKILAQEDGVLDTASGAVGLPVSDGIGPEFGVAKSPSIITGLTGVSPMSQGAYMSVYPFGTYGIAESVREWALKPETQNRFFRKYGENAGEKLWETVLEINESISDFAEPGPKHFNHIRENIDKTAGILAYPKDNVGLSGSVPSSGRYKDGDFVEEDWSDVKHQDPRGGLKASGVRAYRRQNPGSKLKTAVRTPPSKLKKGGKSWKRRKSFCARMSGMKKRLTSAKTARDPNSRINKSLRAWNCEE